MPDPRDDEEPEEEVDWADEAEQASADDPPPGGEAEPPLLTPLPGMGGYNPIFGFGGAGAVEEAAPGPARLREGCLPGDTLLTLEGRRAGAPSLILVALGGTGVIAGACLALEPTSLHPDLVPWPTLLSASHSWVIWALALVVLGLGFAMRVWLGDADVTFTTDGVARHGVGADSWTPWTDVRGYKVAGDGLVLLELEQGQVPIVARDEERRGKVLAILDQRGVPRRA